MYLSLLFRQEEYERNLKYWPAMWDVAAGLEINQLKLHNYVASGTCPKPLQSSGCQGGRLEEIVVTTCYRSFLSLVGQKILSDTNDYKVFRKAGKYKRGLRHSKAYSDPWSEIWTWEDL